MAARRCPWAIAAVTPPSEDTSTTICRPALLRTKSLRCTAWRQSCSSWWYCGPWLSCSFPLTRIELDGDDEWLIRHTDPALPWRQPRRRFATFGVALFLVADMGRLRILRWSAGAMVVIAVGI